MTVAAANMKLPNITPIFFTGDPPEGHLASERRKPGYLLQIVLFSEQENRWIR
jgi:hypothetical protein